MGAITTAWQWAIKREWLMSDKGGSGGGGRALPLHLVITVG